MINILREDKNIWCVPFLFASERVEQDQKVKFLKFIRQERERCVRERKHRILLG